MSKTLNERVAKDRELRQLIKDFQKEKYGTKTFSSEIDSNQENKYPEDTLDLSDLEFGTLKKDSIPFEVLLETSSNRFKEVSSIESQGSRDF